MGDNTSEVEVKQIDWLNNGTIHYNYIKSDNPVIVLKEGDIDPSTNEYAKYIYCITSDVQVSKYYYNHEEKDIGNKTVYIPKLKTSKNLNIIIPNAEIHDDSLVQSEIRLGTDENALILVAQNLWLEKSVGNNNYYTIIDYCEIYISSGKIYMEEKYKYSITKENTCIKYLKYINNTCECEYCDFYIYNIYIAENLKNISLLYINYFYETTIPDIKSPFYGDSMLCINGIYDSYQIFLEPQNTCSLIGNNIYFLYDSEQDLTTPLSCKKELLDVEYINYWDDHNTDNDFKIHNLKKLKITNLDIPDEHKLRNLDGDIEITGNFTMGSNSVIQCKKLTF